MARTSPFRPSDFSFPYADPELTTTDNVKIRVFLLPQRHVLNMNKTPIEWDGQSKQDVRHAVPLYDICGKLTGSTIVGRNATYGAHVSS
jgi:hypothetical protein